ncbi:DUF2089 family protein [Kallipyga gabonensis]|uniref:DUF2089 family protein n=1 Tax=Kallipyga gabonensis TaxID=1686287 RepID=UPI0006B4BE02|nr:DUF2089 family protein [Kallipyga gabonensis]
MKDLKWLEYLDSEEVDFIKNFIISSGSLKKLAEIYNVSYPTVRIRLNRLIQKIQLNDNVENEPYVKFIKSLAIDDKIEVNIAKLLIQEYRKEEIDNE